MFLIVVFVGQCGSAALLIVPTTMLLQYEYFGRADWDAERERLNLALQTAMYGRDTNFSG
jgi:hypothetical protein